jgi:hypothetical protein
MLWCVLWFSLVPSAPYVTLSHTQAFTVAPQTPRLRLAFTLHNDTSAALHALELRIQYQAQSYTTLVPVQAPAFGTHQVTLEQPLHTSPKNLQHVHITLLSYALFKPTIADLWQLYDSSSSADQRSLCHTAGLLVPHAQSTPWPAHTVASMIQDLFAPMPRKTSQKDMLWRLWIVRALGMVRTAESQQALHRAQAYQPFAAYQELLPVIRIAHTRDTPYNAPLFFLWPNNTLHFKDVVSSALQEPSLSTPTPHTKNTPHHPPKNVFKPVVLFFTATCLLVFVLRYKKWKFK